jgi:hypothetical protein
MTISQLTGPTAPPARNARLDLRNVRVLRPEGIDGIDARCTSSRTRCCVKKCIYSSRSATTGSTVAARREGKYDAAAVTISIRAATLV